MTITDTSCGDGDAVGMFLAANGLSVDEGYELIVGRTSECRLKGYYPSYFYDSKTPLINSELIIDRRRPSSLRRFSNPPPDDKDTGHSSRFSSSLLREWNSFTSPRLRPKKQKIKNLGVASSAIEGCLMKKTAGYGGMNVRWEKRFVVLSDECLKYTKSKDIKSVETKWRVYPFTTQIANACRVAQDGITLIIDGNAFGYPRMLELQASNASDAKLWCDKLNTAARNHY